VEKQYVVLIDGDSYQCDSETAVLKLITMASHSSKKISITVLDTDDHPLKKEDDKIWVNMKKRKPHWRKRAKKSATRVKAYTRSDGVRIKAHNRTADR